MARTLNKLTATAIKNAVREGRRQKLFDGGGLYLHVQPSGAYWRLKYRFQGREKLLSLGVYPDVTLKEARSRREEAKNHLSSGIDPGAKQKPSRSEEGNATFEDVAREWWEHVHRVQVVDSHAQRNLRRLERDVFPFLGQTPSAEITPPLVLDTLRKIEVRGHTETAHRVKNLIGQVMRYGVATGRAERDPTQDLRDALAPSKSRHMPAVTDPEKLGQLLRLFEGYQGGPVVRAALRLAPMFFVRPGELRQAQWDEIDLEARQWCFTTSKTKTQQIVPLAAQAASALEELYLLTGKGRYVFPSARSPRGDRPMSENAVLAALRSLGIEKDLMTGHGFRATARTLLDEVLGYPPHLIEQQLGHVVRDPLGRAYNRTAHLDERKKMMQHWADYLDSLTSSD